METIHPLIILTHLIWLARLEYTLCFTLKLNVGIARLEWLYLACMCMRLIEIRCRIDAADEDD